MKRIYSIIIASTLILSAQAQVSKTNSQTTTTKHSGSTVPKIGNCSSGVVKTEHKTTNKSHSNDPGGTKATSRPDKRMIKMEPDQSGSTTTVISIEVKNAETKETDKPAGEIRKVNAEPQVVHLEDKTDQPTDPSNSGNPVEVVPYIDNEEKKVMPEGLSQDIPSNNDGKNLKGTSLTCEEMTSANRARRNEILNRYEFYDLSTVRRCMKAYVYPKEDRWTVTCLEFESFNDARKTHILTNETFYNVDDLKNCDSYKKFKESLTIETEE